MSYCNYIHIDETQLDKSVYRIMSVDRLLDALRSRQLTLVKPKLWDDPFENALLAAEFDTSSGERMTLSAKDSVYGQCWTLHRETDAMWRIYSPEKNGVRVTSTPRKLFAALAQSDPKYWEVRAFIGKVTYKKKTDLLAALGRIKILDSNGSGIAESLLLKRNEFRHEAEVRLIYSGQDGACLDNLYRFAIDPSELFEKMMFDPRMGPSVVKKSRDSIRKLGFSGTVIKSGLYRAPKGLVFQL